MTQEEARHLISRTGFGAAPHEIEAMTGKSYAEGIAQILDGLSATPSRPMPRWTELWGYPADFIWALGQTEAELFETNRYMELEELAGWWMAEMVATPSPMTERLTLFWHDHFATSAEDHANSQWVANQNQFFRANAAGNFSDLAHGILRDPAMLVYLTNVENFADAPNENLGREFLELFTLGEGRGYTQDDVRAAARMLTGHSVAEITAPIYTFYPEDHDHGSKTLLGQTGRFDAADLARIALSDPNFGPYIVEKLWREFISDTPDPAEVARLTELWKANDLDLKLLLDAMLNSDAFWDPANRGRLVKSPIELLVGTIRTLGLDYPNATALAWFSAELNQMPFHPPNVGGWPSGTEWITDATATGRSTLITYLLYEEGEAYDGASMTMMADADAAPVAQAGPADLRVGKSFAVEAEDWGSGLGALIVLYDVSFGGETWRSLPLWIEADEEEDFSGFGILATDCRPRCFASVETEEESWVWFGPYEKIFEEDLYGASQADKDLIAAIATHLPEIVASTEGQSTWLPDPDEPDYVPASITDMGDLAQRLSNESTVITGTSPGALVSALSNPAVLGLDGLNQVAGLDDLDSYLEAAEQAKIRPATPAVVYPTAREWMNALPGTRLESDRAAAVLLAVPRQNRGQRDEMIATDPEALIRSLILSPEYQVN